MGEDAAAGGDVDEGDGAGHFFEGEWTDEEGAGGGVVGGGGGDGGGSGVWGESKCFDVLWKGMKWSVRNASSAEEQRQDNRTDGH